MFIVVRKEVFWLKIQLVGIGNVGAHAPKLVSLGDSFAIVNRCSMATKFTFEISQEVFVVSQLRSPKQKAYAVLNDQTKITL